MKKKFQWWTVAVLIVMGSWACDLTPPTGKDQMPDNDLYGDLTSGTVDSVTTTKGIGQVGFDADYGGLNRTIWNKPEQVMDLLGDLTEKTVADIGAGTGFFSLRLAGKADKVIALDIDPTYVSLLDSVKRVQLPAALHNRLETRLATPDDPKLQSHEIDAALLANVYMYMRNRVSYLRKVKASMRPGGKLLIIDFKKKALPLGPPVDIKLSMETVERELRQAGFKNVHADAELLDYQYIVMGQLD